MADDVADLGGLKWFLWGLQHRDREVLECWLRSDEPITPEFRAFLADLVAGKDKLAKLPVGGRKKGWSERMSQNLQLTVAAGYVEELKRVWRERDGRKYRVHDEAVKEAAERCGVDPQTLGNYLRRSKNDRRRI
jgi:hypothetical protein